MAKFLMEDMVKAKRVRKDVKEIKKEIPEKEFVKKEVQEIPEIYSKSSKSRPKYTLWFVAFLSILFFFFAISLLFSNAKIIVNPKIEDITLNQNFSASKQANNGSLFFDLVVISGEEKTNIQATEEKDVVEKATGTVVIFNSFSSVSQKLSIDTRLEGSNGKIYKTQSQITVPGKNTDGTPGSVEVGIYANGAGVEYNSGPLDFTIIGFKGTPKYDKFKVRSKAGSEIKGGFVGKAPIVPETEKLAAVSSLKTALSSKLLQKATDQIPEGFILFKDAIFLNADETNVSSTYNEDKSMTLVLKGTLYGLLFSEEKLTKKIAENSISKYGGEAVYLPNIQDLKFSLAGGSNVAFDDLTNIAFNLSGDTKVVWKVDEEKFKTSLLGKSKNNFIEILSQYVNIDSANLKINPPWSSSIPEKAEEVEVRINYPE